MKPEIQNILTGVESLIASELPNLLKKRYDIIWKPDDSPVTAADIYLENAIRSFLDARLPDLTFIGEESGISGKRTPDGWVAVLDPIDGTENCCAGRKELGASLSIWKGSSHAGSMLLMPELGEVMKSASIPKIPRSRIVGFSSSYNSKIGEGLSEAAEGRIMGCAVYNLFNVIRGSYARFVNPKGAKSWDLIAGVALAAEAGCEVFLNGEEYDGRFLEADQRYRVDIRHRHDLHSGEGALCE